MIFHFRKRNKIRHIHYCRHAASEHYIKLLRIKEFPTWHSNCTKLHDKTIPFSVSFYDIAVVVIMDNYHRCKACEKAWIIYEDFKSSKGHFIVALYFRKFVQNLGHIFSNCNFFNLSNFSSLKTPGKKENKMGNFYLCSWY